MNRIYELAKEQGKTPVVQGKPDTENPKNKDMLKERKKQEREAYCRAQREIPASESEKVQEMMSIPPSSTKLSESKAYAIVGFVH